MLLTVWVDRGAPVLSMSVGDELRRRANVVAGLPPIIAVMVGSPSRSAGKQRPEPSAARCAEQDPVPAQAQPSPVAMSLWQLLCDLKSAADGFVSGSCLPPRRSRCRQCNGERVKTQDH